MPEISIVVPVYNAERYMRDTVNALLRQTFGDIEIILVDDGSTDSSGKICDELSALDGRVRTIHTENRGVSAARNTGVSAAVGRYISFFDADDTPFEDMCETLLSLIREHNADIVIGALITVFEDGTERIIANGEGDFCSDDREYVLRRFLSNDLGVAVNKLLIKAELAKSVSFDEGLRINEDKLYLFNILRRAGRVYYRNKPIYTYFRRQGSSSLVRFSAKHFDSLTVAEKIDKIIRSDYPRLAGYSRAALATTQLWLLKIMYFQNGRGEYRSDWDRLVDALRALDGAFCKRYLKRNDYIKWLSLKLGTPVFILVTRLFSKN